MYEFRPLPQAEIRPLLLDRWLPAGVTLPEKALVDQEVIVAIIRVTGGNFRLLDRLLTQIARLLEINALDRVIGASRGSGTRMSGHRHRVTRGRWIER